MLYRYAIESIETIAQQVRIAVSFIAESLRYGRHGPWKRRQLPGCPVDRYKIANLVPRRTGILHFVENLQKIREQNDTANHPLFSHVMRERDDLAGGRRPCLHPQPNTFPLR